MEKASDGGYGVYLTNGIFSGMGVTPQAAKKDMIDSIRFYVATCQEEGRHYPKWMNGDYEIVYQFDIQSLLRYYHDIFTKDALHRLTGIRQNNSVLTKQGLSVPVLHSPGRSKVPSTHWAKSSSLLNHSSRKKSTQQKT